LSLPQPSEVNLVERPATSDDAEFRTEVLMASRHLVLSTNQERRPIIMPIGFGQVVIDSLHADEIAAFWSALLERPVIDGASQFFAMIPASDDGSFPALMFLAVPEPREGKNRLHLDLVAADLPAEVERAVSLGATKVADFDEYGATWTTLTDPEGNIFDIGTRHFSGNQPAN
jgi:hypothetical protein